MKTERNPSLVRYEIEFIQFNRTGIEKYASQYNVMQNLGSAIGSDAKFGENFNDQRNQSGIHGVKCAERSAQQLFFAGTVDLMLWSVTAA